MLGRSDSRIEVWTISGRSVPNNTLHLIRTRHSQTEKQNFTVQADHERTSQSASQRIANAVCEEYLYYVSLFLLAPHFPHTPHLRYPSQPPSFGYLKYPRSAHDSPSCSLPAHCTCDPPTSYACRRNALGRTSNHPLSSALRLCNL